MPDLRWPLLIASLVLMVAGIAFRQWAVFVLGRFFTVDARVPDHQTVVERGPYRWVRHPAYTGLVLTFVGIGLALENWAALALLIVVPIAALVSASTSTSRRCGAIELLKEHVPVLSLGVLYLFAVLPVAAWGLAYAIPVSIAGMAAFNFLFLPPLYTFTLADSRNWFALAVFARDGGRGERAATRRRTTLHRQKSATVLSGAPRIGRSVIWRDPPTARPGPDGSEDRMAGFLSRLETVDDVAADADRRPKFEPVPLPLAR